MFLPQKAPSRARLECLVSWITGKHLDEQPQPGAALSVKQCQTRREVEKLSLLHLRDMISNSILAFLMRNHYKQMSQRLLFKCVL